ncbi:MAG: ABC transporter ATP-binding protein/permease [Lachnospiraceae bacterium]|nr:ABC transporter ATP-binding protein/permease [Lachnospiraceae bacterium]
MKGLYKYLNGYKKECFLAPFFKLLEAAFELTVPLVIASLIDTGLANGDKGYVVKMVLILVAFAFVGYGFAITAQFFAAKAATGFATKLRHALFAHIMKLSFKESDKQGTSTLITRMTSDVNQTQTAVNLFLRLFLRSPIIVFGALIMAFTVDAKAAVIFAVVIPLLFVIVFFLLSLTIPRFKSVQAALDKLLGLTRENLTGVRVIRAFGLEEREIINFDTETDKHRRVQEVAGRISAIMNPATYIVINAALIILLYSGAIRVESGALKAGAVVALVNYMSQILVELLKLANTFISITKGLACANRVSAVFNIPEGMEVKVEVDTDAQNTDGKDTHTESSAISEASREKNSNGKYSAVKFSHVYMKYNEGGEDALEDIDFEADYGTVTGIIGGTGSGKTSIVNLIPRFYDAEKGTVYVAGRDVKDYEVASLRDMVGTVMQKAVLFKGTVRENLKWGNADATDDELKEAMQLAQISGIELDREVEQEGRNFSGGQKQRLSIARTLVAEPPILILDDSSSALDYATDAALRKALRTLPWKPAIFIVSQRASTVQHADKILVLDDGRLVGQGTHEELINTCDVYKEIYASTEQG